MKPSSIPSLLLTFLLAALIHTTYCRPLTVNSMSKPTIVLVTGAFHVDSVMDVLGGRLQEKGYNTRTKGLVTVNGPGLTVKDDVNALLDLLQPLIVNQGKDVVLYLHSYAGFPGSAAIGGLSKKERNAKGQQGGIIGLVYQSAFIPQEGDTLLKMIGGNYAPWQSPDQNTGLISVIDPKKTFYADVNEPLASEAASQIYGQSIVSFNSPSGPVYYADPAYNNHRVYIHTEEDQALPPFAQDLFVSNSKVQWDVRKLNSSHSPFLSEPDALAQLVQDIVDGFAKGP